MVVVARGDGIVAFEIGNSQNSQLLHSLVFSLVFTLVFTAIPCKQPLKGHVTDDDQGDDLEKITRNYNLPKAQMPF